MSGLTNIIKGSELNPTWKGYAVLDATGEYKGRIIADGITKKQAITLQAEIEKRGMTVLQSFEEIHLDFKSQGLVETKQQTKDALIKLCREGLYEKQVMKDTNQTYYRKTSNHD